MEDKPVGDYSCDYDTANRPTSSSFPQQSRAPYKQSYKLPSSLYYFSSFPSSSDSTYCRLRSFRPDASLFGRDGVAGRLHDTNILTSEVAY
jgi:hypothetical protein